MPLTQEQISEVKKQLFQQIQHLPQQQKEQMQQQIDLLSEKEVESLLEQQRSHKGKSGREQKSIFRMIVDGDIEAAKIDENKDALAVLDINPISKGHALLIPKHEVKQAKKLPVSIFSLGKKLAQRIMKICRAKNAELQTEAKFGEVILHIIPEYDKPLSLSSPRQKASPEELSQLAFQLKPKKKIPRIKISSKVQRIQVRQKRRIP